MSDAIEKFRDEIKNLRFDALLSEDDELEAGLCPQAEMQVAIALSHLELAEQHVQLAIYIQARELGGMK